MKDKQKTNFNTNPFIKKKTNSLKKIFMNLGDNIYFSAYF
jgi:hypothetical protein